MINRINLILRAKNITARQFAEEIGVQPSGMSHILGGRNNPSLDFVQKVIKRYPEIDANWLLMGRGEMYFASAKGEMPQEDNRQHEEEVRQPLLDWNEDMGAGEALRLPIADEAKAARAADAGGGAMVVSERLADAEDETTAAVAGAAGEGKAVAASEADGKQVVELLGRVEQVMMIYADGTFEVLHRRRKN
ncbi:MAG: helix-turn-helix transcriptional regulator [Bacteroidales bacterium]|nr:helix-turn-helix transcriptional regulator [Bacteroidales bacterium]